MPDLSKARYVALSTWGGHWWVVAYGDAGVGRDTVREQALAAITDEYQHSRADSIYHETEVRNLTVMSQSAARRAFPGALADYDEYGLTMPERMKRYTESGHEVGEVE